MAAALKVVPRQTTALAKVLHQIDRAEKSERDVIALLPTLTLDELIYTRNSARLLHCTAWKIEIACDAEIWDRAQSLSQTGKKDLGEKGIMAQVNKRAEEIGCGASTVRANARLYRRFAPLLSTEQGLDDKGFYQAAMKADDPEAKLQEWAQKKVENPFFRVADAWREVAPQADPEPDEQDEERQPEIEALHTKEVQAFLGEYIETLQSFEERVPLTARFLRGMVQAHVAQAHWQKHRTVEADCEAIMLPVNKYGTVSEDDLCTWLLEHGYFMSDPEFEDRLEYMQQASVRMLSKTDAGRAGKQEERRGKLPQVYVPWFKDWSHLKRRDDDDEDAA